MAYVITTPNGKRTERKALITVAVWGEAENREACILGARTTDSSIDFNGEVETSTDILGINYTDLNRTQPQQSFDPAYVLGGDKLMAYLHEAALENDLSKFNGAFNVYIVTAYYADGASKYRAVKHSNCSIIPNSLGGDAHVSMPFTVFYSNDITLGSVNSIAKEALLKMEDSSAPTFTADSEA